MTVGNSFGHLGTLSSSGQALSDLTCCRRACAALRTGCSGSVLDRVDVTCT